MELKAQMVKKICLPMKGLGLIPEAQEDPTGEGGFLPGSPALGELMDRKESAEL